MIPTDFLTHMRLILDDPGEPTKPIQTWSDQQIIFHTTHHVQSLSRIQAQRDQGFHNFTLALRASDAVSVLANVWQWTLPAWVMSISEVNRVSSAIATTDLTFSPYRWANAMQVGDPIPRCVKGSGFGWGFEGNRVFRLYGEGSAPDIALQVAKLPAPIIRAVLDMDGVTEQRFRLPSSLEIGTEDYSEGAFINAEFMPIAVDDPESNVEVLGQASRCIYSKANQIVGDNDNARRTDIWLENPMSRLLLAGDTLETVIPIADEHLRLVMLMVARSCYAQIGNIPAQNAIKEELAEQMLLFNNYITPRDTGESGTWRESPYNTVRNDQDQAPARSWA